jgi:hypothetical protein
MRNRSIRATDSRRLKQVLGRPLCLALAAACGSSAGAASYITFTATFDYGTLGMADQATFTSTINSALDFYSTTLQTPNPLNVGILFKADESVGLGQNTTYYATTSYSAFRAGLVANASSSTDTTALSHLPSGPNNPVNGSSTVQSSLPLLRALGYSAAAPGGVDSTVSFKTSLMNLDRTSQTAFQYDLLQVAYHEINEVLGFTSALRSGEPVPTSSEPIGVADLFRYDGSGNRSFTTDGSALSYFSIDGSAHLAGFNQNSGGDYGDFNGMGPNVQDAFSTPGLQLDNAVAEKTALEVIGYNLINFGSPAPIPEPGVSGLLGVALVGFFGLNRLRTKAA